MYPCHIKLLPLPRLHLAYYDQVKSREELSIKLTTIDYPSSRSSLKFLSIRVPFSYRHFESQ